MIDSLPVGYTLLEWIAYPDNATPEQYKLILRKAAEVNTIVMDFMSTNTSTADVFIGYSYSTTGFIGYNNATTMSLGGGYSGGTITPNLTNAQKGDGQRHVVTVDYTSSTALITFGGYDGYGRDKTLYRMTLYKSAVLMNDFVPAMRDSDGNVGLYDVVNGVFAANTGSSTFLYEKAVPPTPVDVASYLIRAGGVLYTVREGALTALPENVPTAALFAKYGMEEPPPSAVLQTLANPAVLKWTDVEELLPMTATVTGTPYPQTLETLVDMTSESVVGIASLTANYSGPVGVRYSTDEKTSFSEEMTMADFLSTDKDALFAAVGTARRLWLEFILPAGAKLTDFQIKFKN